MTYFDDPNRESVGEEPIWTGAGEELPPDPPDGGEGGGTFNPADHTVAEVEEYLAAHPDERESILELERTGKNRATLVGDGTS